MSFKPLFFDYAQKKALQKLERLNYSILYIRLTSRRIYLNSSLSPMLSQSH